MYNRYTLARHVTNRTRLPSQDASHANLQVTFIIGLVATLHFMIRGRGRGIVAHFNSAHASSTPTRRAVQPQLHCLIMAMILRDDS